MTQTIAIACQHRGCTTRTAVRNVVAFDDAMQIATTKGWSFFWNSRARDWSPRCDFHSARLRGPDNGLPRRDKVFA